MPSSCSGTLRGREAQDPRQPRVDAAPGRLAQGVLGTVIVNHAGTPLRSTLDVSAGRGMRREGPHAHATPCVAMHCQSRTHASGVDAAHRGTNQGVCYAHSKPCRPCTKPGPRPGSPGVIRGMRS
eukprot:363369-Chlamydomonas_euryale.AAC.10